MTNQKDKTSHQPPRPVVLCILDGWGHREESENNAIRLAETPNYDALIARCPHSLLETSGEAVGLPAGQMGNSEVGHMNIGGGRVVMQSLPRIDAAFAAGELPGIPAFTDLAAALKASKGTCHLMGLISPGGVHSHQDQITALARALEKENIPVAIHAFMDGRDTPPRSGAEFMAAFERSLEGLEHVRIATVTGRYYAMDRDHRWQRSALAYAAMVDGEGERAESAAAAIAMAYERDEGDEFISATVIGEYAGIAKDDGNGDGDGILMGNFRADRARQILTALVDPDFSGFERRRVINFAARLGMVEYSSALSAHLQTLFQPVQVSNSLGQVIADAGLRQLRIAETEKYAHVTFFLNGGEEEPFAGEERILIPSPKVATYDLQPEMSAAEVTDKLVEAIQSKTFDLIVVNYANPDMVGHTGKLAAALVAVQTIDECLGRLVDALKPVGGALVITADHGNIETMADSESGEPHTAHTTGKVPFLLVNTGAPEVAHGRLADVAPTILDLMGLAQPPAMTGHSLLAGLTSSRPRDGHGTEPTHATV
ncbi:MAG: 2,3-bisphosphoglycerate-independent phosphoglycerate mutase [Proteobacteria bacterium]|nr:2,3-bisphosphoglycerate-independent phosphoglycerate mutase [Pseudomonadota bacterium]